MEGKIICRENIKPSSATPDEKRIHKLCLLDQHAIPLYVPLVSYYPNNNNNNNVVQEQEIDDLICEKAEILKRSLSATLSSFYPLAGRILSRDSCFVDCNDEGALFVVAKFGYNLSDFLKKPELQACYAHLPNPVVIVEAGPESHLAMFQVSFFDCGGIAIGSMFSHTLADGATMATFMKAWAAATASGVAPPPSDYNTAKSLFNNLSVPEMEPNLISDFVMMNIVKLGKTMTRRYVFDASGISEIRSQLTMSSSEQRRPPSRFETVLAVIWQCFIAAATAANKSTNNHDDGQNSLYGATFSVNMRRKADPPFPENSFGNLVWSTAASTTDTQTGTDLGRLFSLVRSAVDKVDVNLLKRMLAEQGFAGYRKNIEEILERHPADAEYLCVSSYCNFGLYNNMDFGWGKPMWVTRCDGGSGDKESPFVNSLWLIDTKEGDGVEAWLTLEQRYFAELDKVDHQLLHLASRDPTPFNIDH